MRSISRVILATGILISLSSLSVSGQTIIWTDNFNNGCTSDCIANTWGGWTIQNNIGGTTGSAPNNWYVSCAEEGIAPPGCGSSCLSDASLHIGANPGAGGDMGASFNETAATNATFRRVVSPTINTTGYSTITLNFDFIAYGSAACSDDRAQLHLSTDNGATWPAGFQYCLNSVCCGGAGCDGYTQGQWTLYTLALPAAFDNNPNVRVGFHWRNNGNGSGTDPSVAIDDVRLSVVVTPVELTVFRAEEKDSRVKLHWASAKELNFSNYVVERSSSATGFKTIGTVPGKGVNKGAYTSYSFDDPSPALSPQYYRLKMVDNNGATDYSNIVRVTPGSTASVELGSVIPQPSEAKVNVQLWSVADLGVKIELVDMQGKIVHHITSQKLIPGENNLSLDVADLTAGVYFLRLRPAGNVPEGFDPVNLSQKFVLIAN